MMATVIPRDSTKKPQLVWERGTGHEGDGDPLGAMMVTTGHDGDGDPRDSTTQGIRP